MKKSIIVAMTSSRVIGRDGKLPWIISEDMRLFRDLTMGKTVIMGRNTFESIPKKFRPLPGRNNIVVTSQASEMNFEGVDFCMSINRALDKSNKYGKDIFFIGGSRIYREALGLVDELCVSHVKKKYYGNVFFPEIDYGEWEVVEEKEFEEFVFKRYIRRDS